MAVTQNHIASTIVLQAYLCTYINFTSMFSMDEYVHCQMAIIALKKFPINISRNIFFGLCTITTFFMQITSCTRIKEKVFLFIYETHEKNNKIKLQGKNCLTFWTFKRVAFIWLILLNSQRSPYMHNKQ